MERKDSTASSSSGAASQPSPKIKTEPATAFDLLSGLISKTESKPAPATPQEKPDGNPLQKMLAGIIKTVKPPVSIADTAVEIKAEPIEATHSKEDSPVVKVETIVKKEKPITIKKEPVDTAVKTIGTLGGEWLLVAISL